jgi:hypothetical protein
MATRLYSVSVGKGADGGLAVTEAVGSATTTSAIELTIDLANVLSGSTTPLTRQDVLQALDVLKDYIQKDDFPPA